MVFGMFARKPKRVPLEDQLNILAQCGIHVRRGISIDDFLVSWNREEYERDPFMLALIMLGSEVETEPFGRQCSDDIWHFDTECIEDHGDYVAIAKKFQTLAKGELDIREIRDHVDIKAERAWLEFEFNGRTVHWDARVNSDWVDDRILTQFAELQRECNTARRFTYLDLKGQDCLLGSCTPKELKALKLKTGLAFEWLA